jgi:hypothetical protein
MDPSSASKGMYIINTKAGGSPSKKHTFRPPSPLTSKALFTQKSRISKMHSNITSRPSVLITPGPHDPDEEESQDMIFEIK